MFELEKLLDRFDRLCREGNSRPVLPQFIQEADIPDEQRLQVLVELIVIDMEYRWRTAGPLGNHEDTDAGHIAALVDTQPSLSTRRPLVENYLQEWPEIHEDPHYLRELIVEEYRVRQRFGDRPRIEDVLNRFGEVTALREALDAVDREMDVERTSRRSRRTQRQQEAAATEDHSDETVCMPKNFGRYRFIERLGRGGMGEVFLAEDTQLERRVALKIPHFGDNKIFRQRFINEAKAAATLRHPGICPVFDAGEIDGQPFLSMAYIEGETLRERWQKGGTVSIIEMLSQLADVAVAMQVAHDAGIVHRDLKPANVVIDSAGTPVVMDFGLAHRDSIPQDERITQTGEVFGSPGYMSPEQVEAAPTVGPASDIYSLGAMLFEALAGHLPFSGPVSSLLIQIARDEPPAPSDSRTGIDQELEALCLQMLAKKPEQRPATMTEVAERFTAIRQRLQSAADPSPGTFPKPASTRQQKPSSRAQAKEPNHLRGSTNAWTIVAVVVLPILLLLGVIVFLVKTPQGTVEIRIAEEAAKRVQVNVTQNGDVVKVVDKESGWTMTLDEGRYDFSLGTGGEDFTITPKQVKVSKGATEVVSVTVTKRQPSTEPPKVVQSNPDKPPADPTGSNAIAAPVRGSYLVDWTESSGKSGTIEYTFQSDGRVLKAGRPLGMLEQRRGKWIINYDEDGRGEVALFHFTPNTFAGKHTWGDDNKTATWTATRRAELVSQKLVELNTPEYEEGAWPSRDGLRLYYEGQDDSTDGPDVVVATRPTVGAKFKPQRSVASPARHPSLTADELTLVCLGGDGNKLLCEARRESHLVPFPTPKPIPAFLNTQRPKSPWISADGLTLVFQRDPAGAPPANSSGEFVIATRDTRFHDWKPETKLSGFDFESRGKPVTWPSLSDDGLLLWYAHGGDTAAEVWYATRNSTTEPFETFTPFRVDGQVLLGRSPRFCAMTGELFHSVSSKGAKWDLSFVAARAKSATTPGQYRSPEWVDLLSGNDLTNWQPMLTLGDDNSVQKPDPDGGWILRDGMLVCETDRHGWLKFNQQLSDFELELEYKLPKDANCGIMLRYSGEDWIARAGMEAQIIDDDYSAGPLGATQRSGALYAVAGPAVSKDKPAGQWNQMRIRCEGDRVTISLNGEVTAEADMSKHKKLRNLPRSGMLGIYNGLGEAKGTMLRNMRLRTLDGGSVQGAAANQPTDNYALHFTGSLQYIETPVKLDETQPFTIEAWVAADSPWEMGHVISNQDHGHGYSLTADSNPTQLWWTGPNSPNQRSPYLYQNKPAPPPTHLAVVWDGNQLRFYVDGDTDNGRNIVTVNEMPKFKYPFYLGTSRQWYKKGVFGFDPPSWHQYVGMLDEVRFSTIARYIGRFKPARRHDPDEHTLALYHCDENGGKTLIDSSGNENHGKITGDVAWAPAYRMSQPGRYDEELNKFERLATRHTIPRKGPALQFAARGSYVMVPSVKFDFTQPFTVEAWATPYGEYEPTSSHSRVLAAFGGMTLIIAPGWREEHWNFIAWKTSFVEITSQRPQAVAFERRSHVAAQWNGEQLSMYINGVPVPGDQYVLGSIDVKEFVLERLAEANGKHVAIGAYGSTSQLGGNIDRFRISTKVRYTEPFEPTDFQADADTLVMYDFHEGDGDTLHDVSGNEYHAKITGAEWLPPPKEFLTLPGLVADPHPRKGARRWQVESRWPRAQPVFHSYSPDGTLYSIGSRDGWVRVFDGGPQGKLKCMILADDAIKQRSYATVLMDWAPDGKQFVTATSSGWVRVWNTNGEMQAEWQADLLDVEWSPAGNLIAGADGTDVRLWKTDGTLHSRLRMYDRHTSKHFVSFSPDGKRFAAAIRRRILVADTDGNLLQYFRSSSFVHRLEWSPTDSDRFATMHYDRHVRVWRPNGDLIGSSRYEIPNWGDRNRFDAGWSPDGTRFAIVDQSDCQLFDSDAQPVWKVSSTQHVGWGENLTWTPDSREIQIAKIDRDVVAHRTSDGKASQSFTENPPRLPGMAWNAKRKQFCCVSHIGNSLRLFDEQGQPLGPFHQSKSEAYNCAWSSTGFLTASGHQLRLYPVQDGEPQFGKPIPLQNNKGSEYRVVAAHPTKELVAAYMLWSNRTEILDGEGHIVKTLTEPKGIHQLKFSPDGETLALVNNLGVVLVDTQSWEITSRFKLAYPVVAWSSDGKRMAATNGSTGQVQIYDESGTLQQTIDPAWSQGTKESCGGLAWSPNDRYLVWSRNNDTCCYDFETKTHRSLSRHPDDVGDAAWIDGERFLTNGVFDGTVTAWNAAAGRPLWTLLYVMNDKQQMQSVTFTGDGEVRHADAGVFGQLVYIAETERNHFTTTNHEEFETRHPRIDPAGAEDKE